MIAAQIRIRKYVDLVPMSQAQLDDIIPMGVAYGWHLFRAFPGMEKEAIEARKRMLQLGLREGRIGPAGRLP